MSNPLSRDIDPRILGLRLQEARKMRGLTQEMAAKALEMSRPTFIAIEKGEREINSSELIFLADLYGQSVHNLLRKQEPLRDFVPHFRTAAGKIFSDSTEDSTELEVAASALQQHCEDYLRLEELCQAPMPHRYPTVYPVLGRDAVESAEDIAAEERNRLGLGDGPIPHLRSILETDVGLRIFLLNLPNSVAGLFIYSEKMGGCMAIQRKHPPGRRLWSLAHEYAHFLVHRYEPEITVLRTDRRVVEKERFANSFALSFLMPEFGLRRRFRELVQGEGKSFATLIHLMDLYGVSLEALLLRLEHLRLVQVGTLQSLRKEKFSVEKAKEILGLKKEADDSYLPYRYQVLAVESYKREELSEGELVKFLRTDREHTRRIIQSFKSLPALSEDGELGQMNIDLTQPFGRSKE